MPCFSQKSPMTSLPVCTRMSSHLSSFVWYNGVADICRTQSSIYRYRVGGIQYIQYVASLVGSCFINSLITNNRWHHVLWIFIIEAKLRVRVVQWMNQRRNSPLSFFRYYFQFQPNVFTLSVRVPAKFNGWGDIITLSTRTRKLNWNWAVHYKFSTLSVTDERETREITTNSWNQMNSGFEEIL